MKLSRVNFALKQVCGVTSFRFIMVGSLTAFLYFCLILFFIDFGFGAGASAFFAYGLAFIAGYFAQKRFAFRSDLRHMVSLPKYAILQVSCAVIATSSAHFFDLINSKYPVVIALSTTVTLGFFSYIVSSKWVFRK